MIQIVELNPHTMVDYFNPQRLDIYLKVDNISKRKVRNFLRNRKLKIVKQIQWSGFTTSYQIEPL